MNILNYRCSNLIVLFKTFTTQIKTKYLYNVQAINWATFHIIKISLESYNVNIIYYFFIMGNTMSNKLRKCNALNIKILQYSDYSQFNIIITLLRICIHNTIIVQILITVSLIIPIICILADPTSVTQSLSCRTPWLLDIILSLLGLSMCPWRRPGR